MCEVFEVLVLAKNIGVPGGTSRLFASVQDPKPSCRSPRESRNLGVSCFNGSHPEITKKTEYAGSMAG